MEKNCKYILWDLDGTLTDPMIGITTCVQYALRHLGIEVKDLQELCPFIGPPLLDSFQEFYRLSEAQAQEAILKYRERFATVGWLENEVYPGMPELLDRLCQAGKTILLSRKYSPGKYWIIFSLPLIFPLSEGLLWTEYARLKKR